MRVKEDGSSVGAPLVMDDCSKQMKALSQWVCWKDSIHFTDYDEGG